MYLYHQDDPTGMGLYKVMAMASFFASILLLDEEISSGSRLSLAFQQSTIGLTTIPPLPNSTIQGLETIKIESADSFKAKVEHLITQTVEEGTGLHLPELESASTPETMKSTKVQTLGELMGWAICMCLFVVSR